MPKGFRRSVPPSAMNCPVIDRQPGRVVALLGTALLVGASLLAEPVGTRAAVPGLTASKAGWSLPTPLQRSVVLADGKRLLVLGGLDRSNRSTDQVLAIDPVHETIARTLARLPQATHDAAGGIIGGRATVFGGGRGGSVATVQAVGGDKAPAVLAELPRKNSDLAAATVGGTTYLVGGYDGRRALDSVLATRDGRHFREIAKLSHGVRYAAVAVAGNGLIVAGGDANNGKPTDTIFAIDLPKPKVRVLGHLHEPLGHASALMLDGTVFIVGGRTTAGTSRRIWSVNPDTGAVAPAGKLPYAVSDAGAAVLDGRGWLIGGRGERGQALATVLVLNARAAGANRAVPAVSLIASARADEPTWLKPAHGPGHLQSGSDPSVLPGPVLIADRDNNRLVVIDPRGRVRWEFPRAGDLAPGQTFKVPDDAFFTPDGRQIIVTEEDDYVISLVDITSRRIVWRYGKPRVHGHGPNRLWNPDDAIVLPSGHVVVADIKNCRVLIVAPGAHEPLRALGEPGYCAHQPPKRWGSPNGAFPMRNGHYLLTEIRGNWVDEIDLQGHVYWSAHPAGLSYPSDSNEIDPGRYLTVNYATPGEVLIFDKKGRALWRYKPTGRKMLSKPSLALPLPNGDVIINDDANHRIIVIDPSTDRVVWQYGYTRRKGRAAGYLNNPDGMDLLPPHGLLVTHAATMGRP
jgi:outer membrane protein assembly factor BamB